MQVKNFLIVSTVREHICVNKYIERHVTHGGCHSNNMTKKKFVTDCMDQIPKIMQMRAG